MMTSSWDSEERMTSRASEGTISSVQAMAWTVFTGGEATISSGSAGAGTGALAKSGPVGPWAERGTTRSVGAEGPTSPGADVARTHCSVALETTGWVEIKEATFCEDNGVETASLVWGGETSSMEVWEATPCSGTAKTIVWTEDHSTTGSTAGTAGMPAREVNTLGGARAHETDLDHARDWLEELDVR
jgi:hypothetical protein